MRFEHQLAVVKVGKERHNSWDVESTKTVTDAQVKQQSNNMRVAETAVEERMKSNFWNHIQTVLALKRIS